MGDWTFDPLQLAPLALVVAAYAVRSRTLARRGTAVPRWRLALFACGVVLLVAALVSPVAALGEQRFAFHMLQHLLLGDLAPLALLAGLTGPLLRPVLALPPVRALRVLAHPFVALPLWVGAYAVWHVPALYDAALRHPGSLLALEHATYVVTGLLFWWCVWQDPPHRLPSAARAGYAFAAFVLSAPLGLVLALVPEPLYDFYADAPERIRGISRLTDQQLGGMTMAAEQSVVFFAVFAFWFLRFLSEQERADEEVA